jgi:hypothetical protein
MVAVRIIVVNIHTSVLETLISEWYYYPTICHLHNFSDKKFGGTGIWEILHNIFV